MANYKDIATHILFTSNILFYDVIQSLLHIDINKNKSITNGYCVIVETPITFPVSYLNNIKDIDTFLLIWNLLHNSIPLVSACSFILSFPNNIIEIKSPTAKAINRIQSIVKSMLYVCPLMCKALKIGRPDLQSVVAACQYKLLYLLGDNLSIEVFVETVISKAWPVLTHTQFYYDIKNIICNAAIVTKSVDINDKKSHGHKAINLESVAYICMLQKDHILLFLLLFFSDQYKYIQKPEEELLKLGVPVHLAQTIRKSYPKVFSSKQPIPPSHFRLLTSLQSTQDSFC